MAPVFETQIARPQKASFYVVLHGTFTNYGRLKSKYEDEFDKDI